MTASRGQGRRGVRNKKIKNGRHPEPPGCAVALQSCRDAAAALTRRGRRAEPASARRQPAKDYEWRNKTKPEQPGSRTWQQLKCRLRPAERERERDLNCHCGCRVANQAVVKATGRKVIMMVGLGWRGLTID